MEKVKRKKPIWKRLLKVFLWILCLPVVLAAALTAYLYFNQSRFVQQALGEFNETLHGKLIIKSSRISPFHNFPSVSIDLKDVEIFENKTSHTPIVKVKDIYLDFNLRKILKGKYSVNHIDINQGDLLVVQDTAGNFNIAKAFEMKGDTAVSPDSSAIKFGLKNISLNGVNIKHINEANNHIIDLDLQKAKAGFRMGEKSIKVSVEGTLFLTLINGSDTSFFRHKKIELNTSVVYNKTENELTIKPSDVYLEGVSFGGGGKIGFGEYVDLDLQFKGEKSDFNLIFAFLPKETADYMKQFKNAGNIFFNVTVKGAVGGNLQPAIRADFGCENGFFTNTAANKTMDKLFFKGYFTNGEKRDLSTSEFGLTDIKAHPEQGDVQGNIIVRNFNDPNVNMDVNTDFDLQFLSKFLQVKELQNLSGQVNLKVLYKELVDITAPTTFAKLKDGVESELHVRNLTFKYPNYPHTVKHVNIDAVMRNKSLFIENCTMQVGNSDVFLIFGLNNLPAMLHKKEMPLDARLVITSNNLDIKQLTTFDTTKMKPIDEAVTDFQAVITVKTNAKNFSNKKMLLPEGEFTIEKLGGKLKHYPNKLDNVTADVLIDSSSVKIRNFKGISGKSDFSLKAEIKNYNMWFDGNMSGTSHITYDIACDTLRFGRTFSYKKVNYIPDHIRREVLRNFKLKGTAQLTFDKKNLKSASTVIENAEVKSKIHPLPLSRVQGKIKYENERLSARQLTAKLGDNEITVSMAYYLGKDSVFKKDNRISLKAPYLNVNEVMNYDLSKVERKRRKKDSLQVVEVVNPHDTVFNIFSVPFSNMKIKLDVAKLIYNNIELDNFKSRMRMTKTHQFYIDTLSMDVADGHLDIAGVFDGSNAEKLVFRPNITVKNIDLSKLLLRFDNFGQDYILTDNIKGHLNGTISGRVRMHTDLIPIMDKSRIKADVAVYNGELNNYAPMLALKDYFKDKNINNIRFDTLANVFELRKGVLQVPAMNINSTLGFLEIGGQQNLSDNGEMDYKIKVPLKLVTDVGVTYLFGRNREEVEAEQVDDIQYRDKDKKIRFVTINMKGTSDKLKVSLGNRK
ncbi:MAG: hypothetical protein KF900_09995 [Bacteroidetes bacterium]|nr:hypothetical protein [Bacteroidota bacterium]